MTENHYLDVSCQRCGHIPQSEKHLCEPVQEEWEKEFDNFFDLIKYQRIYDTPTNTIKLLFKRLLTSERAHYRENLVSRIVQFIDTFSVKANDSVLGQVADEKTTVMLKVCMEESKTMLKNAILATLTEKV